MKSISSNGATCIIKLVLQVRQSIKNDGKVKDEV